VSASAVNPALTNEQRYQAMLRISEALSERREHDEVARVLADCLSEFLQFEHLDFVVFKGDHWWDWPGNIRELENFIERAVLLTRGKSLEAPIAELRRSYVEELKPAAAQPPNEDIARIVKETLEALGGRRGPADQRTQKQKEEIIRVLTETRGARRWRRWCCCSHRHQPHDTAL
jgi:transcriptional regulator with AAA-type ATPase domain